MTLLVFALGWLALFELFCILALRDERNEAIERLKSAHEGNKALLKLLRK